MITRNAKHVLNSFLDVKLANKSLNNPMVSQLKSDMMQLFPLDEEHILNVFRLFNKKILKVNKK